MFILTPGNSHFAVSTLGWVLCLSQGAQSSPCCHCFAYPHPASPSQFHSTHPLLQILAPQLSHTLPFSSVKGVSSPWFIACKVCVCPVLSMSASCLEPQFTVSLDHSFNAAFKPLEMKPLSIPLGNQYHSCELSSIVGHSFRNSII